MKTYVNIMVESLEKKQQVLNRIIALNQIQSDMLKNEELDMDEFDLTMEKKEELIKQIDTLDDGFEALYERVGEELKKEKETYREQILYMQELIPDISEKIAKIKAQESRMKTALDGHIEKKRQDLTQKRSAGKITQNYYQAMNRLNFVDPQFMDRKK